jgi:hypothetical protein
MATAKQVQWSWKQPKDWTVTSIEEVTVTPELAQHIYDNLGDFNRKISPDDPKVKEYAADMLAGRWALQGLIEFFTTGRLGNGYHRMLAVILAGVPVQMFFRYGAKPENYVYFDKGKNRDGQDTIEVEAHALGEKITASDAKLLATSIPWIVLYECGKASIKGINIHSQFQRDFYRTRFSAKKGEDFSTRAFLPLARKAAARLECAESVVFALMVCGARIPGKITATREFWQGVATGVGLTAGDPRLQFAMRIDKIRREARLIHAKLQRGIVFLYGLKCMREFFDDKKIGLLMPAEKVTRLSNEHDDLFGETNVDFVNPHGEPVVFEAENMKTVAELVAKHEDRGKAKK